MNGKILFTYTLNTNWKAVRVSFEVRYLYYIANHLKVYDDSFPLIRAFPQIQEIGKTIDYTLILY